MSRLFKNKFLLKDFKLQKCTLKIVKLKFLIDFEAKIGPTYRLGQ